MARKEFTYRGKTVEELKKMTVKEFAKLCTSRVRRSIERGFSQEQEKLILHLREGRQNLKTHSRDMPILPEMIDKAIGVYNGKEYVQVRVQPEMIGHLLGEFSLTRKKLTHSSPGVGASKSSGHVSMK
jgi:small subunit ribosomal protein S19